MTRPVAGLWTSARSRCRDGRPLAADEILQDLDVGLRAPQVRLWMIASAMCPPYRLRLYRPRARLAATCSGRPAQRAQVADAGVAVGLAQLLVPGTS